MGLFADIVPTLGSICVSAIFQENKQCIVLFVEVVIKLAESICQTFPTHQQRALANVKSEKLE